MFRRRYFGYGIRFNECKKIFLFVLLLYKIYLINLKILNWQIDSTTSISWLLIYLQVEYDIKNALNSNDSSEKNPQLFLLKNNILQYSVLTNVHRSKDFIQIFSLAVRVNLLENLSIFLLKIHQNFILI